jgi:hypothetical protein
MKGAIVSIHRHPASYPASFFITTPKRHRKEYIRKSQAWEYSRRPTDFGLVVGLPWYGHGAENEPRYEDDLAIARRPIGQRTGTPYGQWMATDEDTLRYEHDTVEDKQICTREGRCGKEI